jgi:hypothetical protein
MKKSLFLSGLGLFLAGCNYTGTPVEYANTCNKENDDKRVEIVGFFNNTGSAMCSKSGNEPMRCPIDFIDAIGSTKIPIRAYIDKGSGASSIDAEKDKPLKIKDDKGEFIENSQKVKIVADVNVLDEVSKVGETTKSAGCYLTVKKIEKTQ